VRFEVDPLRMHIYKSADFIEVLPDTENHRKLILRREALVHESKMREEEERRILEQVRILCSESPFARKKQSGECKRRRR
jgi:hypothetical protein